jgi:hypothetical protein
MKNVGARTKAQFYIRVPSLDKKSQEYLGPKLRDVVGKHPELTHIKVIQTDKSPESEDADFIVQLAGPSESIEKIKDELKIAIKDELTNIIQEEFKKLLQEELRKKLSPITIAGPY